MRNPFMAGLLLVVATILAPTVASATNVDIHVAGMCSTEWTGGGGGGYLGAFTGETSVNAAVDQRDSLSTAAANLKSILDSRCPATGADTCYIYNYSAGDVILNYL